jgi:hypothetical protein
LAAAGPDAAKSDRARHPRPSGAGTRAADRAARAAAAAADADADADANTVFAAVSDAWSADAWPTSCASAWPTSCAVTLDSADTRAVTLCTTDADDLGPLSTVRTGETTAAQEGPVSARLLSGIS